MKQMPVVLSMIRLRFLVGALGERIGWWPSHFTDEIGIRRLSAVFPRTALRASLESVTAVARRDHDPKLHPASVHLFRLRSAQEDMIAHHLAQGTAELAAPPASEEEILTALDDLGPPNGEEPPIGPCSLGNEQRTRLNAAVADLVRVYAATARTGPRAVPYFEGAR